MHPSNEKVLKQDTIQVCCCKIIVDQLLKFISLFFFLTIVCGGRLLATGSFEHLYSHFKFGDANYDKKEDCDWHLVTAGHDKKVYLKFVTFELEHENNCSYDFVEIFDGGDDTAPSLGRFCGNQVVYSNLFL